MTSIDTEKLRHHVRQMTHWSAPHRLSVTRMLGGSSEEILEVHRAMKIDYTCAEAFLACSAENEFGISPSALAATLDAHNFYAKLLNRPGNAVELGEMLDLFKPLADTLPDPRHHYYCLILLNEWNDKWWLIADESAFWSLRWSTSA